MTCHAQVKPSEQESEISSVERQCLDFVRTSGTSDMQSLVGSLIGE